jgi:tetratricopeptide (TPR) repeat protein
MLRRRLVLAGALAVGLLVTAASAQRVSPEPLPAAAAEALAEARSLMARALATYPSHYPDRPLWQEAFAEGRRAVSLAPNHLEPIRFLAEAYSRSRWYGPAWEAWVEYVRRGGRDALIGDRDALQLIPTVGHELGYGAYARGELDRALDYYLTVADVVPTDVNAFVWSGRILVETERPAQAIAYWQRVVELDPGDARAAYFLDLAEDQARWGTRAVNAFREGVAHYEAGSLPEAAERFARASVHNPEYAAAWAWQGRVAFERSRFGDAATYYGRAVALEPGNETYAWFHQESLRRAGRAG